MAEYAYFKFVRVDEGNWPSDHPVQPGAIIRQPVGDLRALPLMAWNELTHDWAQAVWETCGDPALDRCPECVGGPYPGDDGSTHNERCGRAIGNQVNRER